MRLEHTVSGRGLQAIQARNSWMSSTVDFQAICAGVRATWRARSNVPRYFVRQERLMLQEGRELLFQKGRIPTQTSGHPLGKTVVNTLPNMRENLPSLPWLVMRTPGHTALVNSGGDYFSAGRA